MHELVRVNDYMHERARREVNGQGNPEAVLGHALGGSVRMSSYSYSYSYSYSITLARWCTTLYHTAHRETCLLEECVRLCCSPCCRRALR